MATGPTRPEDLPLAISSCAQRGDLDGVIGLYEAKATFAPDADREFRGRAAIRVAMKGMNPARVEVEPLKVLEADGTALVITRWSWTGTGSDGKALEATGTAANVARRGDDGVWRLLIDNPAGIET